MDLSKLSDADVKAIAAGDMSRVSEAALRYLASGDTSALQPKDATLGGSLKRGIASLLSSQQTGAEALMGDAAEAGRRGAEREKAAEGQYGQSRVGWDRVSEAYGKEGLLGGAKEIASQIPHALAEQAPNLAQMAATGRLGAMVGSLAGPVGTVVGAGLGAFAPSALSQLGSNVQRQTETQPGAPVDMGKAGTAAAAQGALDVVGNAIPLGKTLIGKILGPRVEALIAKGNVEAAERLAKETLPKVLAKGTATGVLAETPTEVLQQVAERWQAGLSLTDADALKEYGQTAYQTALLGPVGAAGRVSERGAAQERVAQNEAQQQAAAAEQTRKDAEAKAAADAQAAQEQAALQAQRDVPTAPTTAEDSGETVRTPEMRNTLRDTMAKYNAAVAAAGEAARNGDIEAAKAAREEAAQHKQTIDTLQQSMTAEPPPAEVPPAKRDAELTKRLNQLQGTEGKPGLYQRALQRGEFDVAERFEQELAALRAELDQRQQSAQRTAQEADLLQRMQQQPELAGGIEGMPTSKEDVAESLAEGERQRAEVATQRELDEMERRRINTGRTDQLSLLDTTPQTRTVVNRGEGAAPAESREDLIAQLKAARATRNTGLVQEIVDKLRAMQAYTPEASKEPSGVLAHRVSPTTSAPAVETTYTTDKAPDAEAIRTAVAQLPEKLNPYYDALATRIQQNADAIASNPENASMVSGLLYQMRTNPMPGGNVQSAQLRDVTDMLNTLEQGKRSETETLPSGEVRTAVQKDMFPQQQYQGTILASGKSFQKFLASEALQKMRSLMGIAGQTLSRAMKRAEPLQRRVAQLEESLRTVQDKYDRTVASFDRLDAQAQQAYEAATARLKAVRDRLDAELQPLQADYLQAQQALKEATDYARDITETMRANNMRIEGLEQLADLQNQLAQAMQQPANKAGWDHMRTLQREIAATTAKLEGAFGTAGGEAATFARANTVLQKRLSNELNQLGDLHATYTKAKETLDRVAANQARRVTTKRDLAAGEAGVRAAQSGVSGVQAEARAKARTEATSAVAEEAKQTAGELRQAKEDLKGAGVEEVRKRAEERRAPPKTAETQSEREARDGEKRRAQQAALERAEADTFTVSFEGQRKMRDFLNDAPDALEQLEFMRQEAMDEGNQQAYKSLSTRINKMKGKVDLYTDLLNGGTAAQAKLVARMREQQAKIDKLKDKLAAAETARQRKSRRDSLTEAEKVMQNMFQALQGQRGITYTPKKPEKLETEAPVAGTRLGERAVGPIVRNAVFPGNIRTGTEESKAGENKTKTTTKAAQSTVKPRSARAITAEEQAEANRIGEEIRSKPAEDVEEKPVPKRAKSKAESALDDIYADETFDDYTRTIDEARTEGLTKLDETASAAVRDGKVETLLKHLSENAQNPLHRELAKRLLPLVTGTKIGVVRNLKLNGETVEGVYRYDANTVDINPLYMSEETVLHELLHAATVQVIQRPASQRTAAQNAAVRELEGMHKALQANPKFKDQLASKNLAEFVAEVYTNKPLRDAMDSVGKPTSLLQRFWSAVKRLFGIEGNSPSGKAIDAINQIMDESQVKRMESGPTEYTRTATAKQPGWMDSLANMGRTLETLVADMRAPLMDAIYKMGPSNAATQAHFSMRQADQTTSLVQAFMANGAPVLDKDAKGLRYVATGSGPSGMDVMRSVQGVPGKTAEDKFRKATDYMLGLQAERLGYARFGNNADRIKALMAEVNTDAKLKDGLEAFRKVYNQYNEALVRMVEATGAFSTKDADAYLKHGDYVPRYRQHNGQLEMAFGDMGYRRVGDIKNTPFLHSFKGGKELILPINETLLHNTMLLTSIATTNMAKHNIGCMLSAAGKDAKKMQVRSVKKGGAVPRGAEYITWTEQPRDKEDSGERYIEVDTKGTPLEGMDPYTLVHSLEATPVAMPAIINAVAKLNDYLRAGITRTPIYVARQLLRDPMSAASVTGMKADPFTAVAKTLGEYAKSFTGNETLGELNKRALIQNPLVHGTMDDIEKLTLQFGTTGSVGKVRKVLNFLDQLAHNADAATRAQIWKDSKARGMSDVEASLRVMESMNFHKRGSSGSVQVLSRLIPFLNSSIQAINTAALTLRGKAPFEERVNAKQTFVKNMLMLGLAGFAYAGFMHDSDDDEKEKYGDLPLKDRFGNIHLRIPGTDYMMRLPIGYAESGGLAWALGQALFESNKSDADIKRIASALGTYTTTGLPNSAGIPVPSGLKQAIEWGTNVDLRTFNPIVPARLQDNMPETQVAPTTPSAYVVVGQTLGLSPIKLQHTVDSLVGSLASDMLGVADRMFGETKGGERPTDTPETTPFLRSFMQRSNRADAADAMYELADRVKKVKGSMDDMRRDGRVDELQEFLTKYRAEAALAPLTGAFTKAMGDLNTRKRMIEVNTNIPGDAKRERIKALEDVQERMAQNYLKAARQVQERLAPA